MALSIQTIINASYSEDSLYRYMMPTMITRMVRGHGRGIKTNVVNMVDVARALARPASYIIKYFGYELGAQSMFDKITGLSLVNGSHHTEKLAGLLENFINKYVLCYLCRNPETEILITKTQTVQLKCASCGFVSEVDMKDKLTSYILKKENSKHKKAADDKNFDMMPTMITNIDGRGNNVKTNIVNMVDVAKALARPACYITKYFGNEIGAPSKFDEETGVSLVNGCHHTAKLAGLLENFIKKFVLCYGCGNPETEISTSHDQMVQLKCYACGYVSNVDMRDRLTSYILMNDHKHEKAMRRAAAGDDKLMKKKKKKKLTKYAVKNTKDDDDDDVEWIIDPSAEAPLQLIQETHQPSTVTADTLKLTKENRPYEFYLGRLFDQLRGQSSR